MNCHCQPGQLAVLRKSSKKNENFGKEFYCCPTNSCNFFHWADSKVPPPLQARKPRVDALRFPRPPPTVPAPQNMQPGQSTLPAAKFTLVSFKDDNLFLGLTCPSHASIVTFMQNHRESCIYDHGLKMWTFELKHYEQILKLLRDAGFQPEELPRFLTEGIKKYLLKLRRPGSSSSAASTTTSKLTSSSEYNYPAEPEVPILKSTPEPEIQLNITPSMSQLLLPFQVDGVRFIINHGGRGLIGDEMGCGKTVQAIALLQHYRQHWPALIVMPTNLTTQWESELLKYCGELLRPRDICHVRSGKDHILGKIILIPYSLIDKFVEKEIVVAERFGMIIADESHKLKNSDTKTASVVVPLLKTIPIAICLSGTPMLNRPVELYTQLHGLLPTVFNDFHGFAKRYCNSKLNDFGKWDHSGSSHEAELKLLLDSMVMIRRLKAEVIHQLPTKNRELQYVEVDAAYAGEIARIQEQQAVLEAELKSSSNKTVEERQKICQQKDQLLLHYYQTTGLAKIGAIKKQILQLIESSRVEKAMKESELLQEQNPSKELYFPEKEEKNEQKQEPTVIYDLFTEDNEEVQILDKLDASSKEKEDKESIDADILVDTDDEQDEPHRTSRKSSKRQKGKRISNESDSERTIELLDSDEEEYDDYYDDGEESYSPSITDDATVEVDDGDEEVDFNDAELYFKTENPRNTRKRKSAAQQSNKAKRSKHDNTDNPPVASIFQKRTPSSLEKKIPLQPKVLGRKILLFAHHRAVLDAMEDVLREANVKYIRVDGSVNTTKKGKLINQFQNDDETDIALLSITACGTGLNLTRASIAVFAELNWSPGVNGQAEDRIHRLGQESSDVRIIYILARNTSDDIVWDLIQRKSSTIRATIGNGDRSSKVIGQPPPASQSNRNRNNKNHAQQRIENFVAGSSQNSQQHSTTQQQPQQYHLPPTQALATNSSTANNQVNSTSHPVQDTHSHPYSTSTTHYELQAQKNSAHSIVTPSDPALSLSSNSYHPIPRPENSSAAPSITATASDNRNSLPSSFSLQSSNSNPYSAPTTHYELHAQQHSFNPSASSSSLVSVSGDPPRSVSSHSYPPAPTPTASSVVAPYYQQPQPTSHTSVEATKSNPYFASTSHYELQAQIHFTVPPGVDPSSSNITSSTSGYPPSVSSSSYSYPSAVATIRNPYSVSTLHYEQQAQKNSVLPSGAEPSSRSGITSTSGYPPPSLPSNSYPPISRSEIPSSAASQAQNNPYTAQPLQTQVSQPQSSRNYQSNHNNNHNIAQLSRPIQQPSTAQAFTSTAIPPTTVSYPQSSHHYPYPLHTVKGPQQSYLQSQVGKENNNGTNNLNSSSGSYGYSSRVNETHAGSAVAANRINPGSGSSQLPPAPPSGSVSSSGFIQPANSMAERTSISNISTTNNIYSNNNVAVNPTTQLSPQKLAQIERNRIEAQKRLAATKERERQQREQQQRQQQQISQGIPPVMQAPTSHLTLQHHPAHSLPTSLVPMPSIPSNSQPTTAGYPLASTYPTSSYPPR